MSTLVCFHAHPDDECITTGGVIAQAAADGHRVVLVLATRGELGDIKPHVLSAGEQLTLRRTHEVYQSGTLLGIARIEFLGYVDSGMVGDPGNDEPWSFWQADTESAAQRLAALLREEQADVLTVYDENGVYGHPDHIKVHDVGVRAAEIAGVENVFMATANRDQQKRLVEFAQAAAAAEAAAAERGGDAAEPGAHFDPADLDDIPAEIGVAESRITHAIDVKAWCELKRQVLRAHASQVGPTDFFLTIPDEIFAEIFGTEWFIKVGSERDADAPFLATLPL